MSGKSEEGTGILIEEDSTRLDYSRLEQECNSLKDILKQKDNR